MVSSAGWCEQRRCAGVVLLLLGGGRELHSQHGGQLLQDLRHVWSTQLVQLLVDACCPLGQLLRGGVLNSVGDKVGHIGTIAGVVSLVIRKVVQLLAQPAWQAAL